MSWESFFASLDSLRRNLSAFFNISPPACCRLYTADGDGVLVTDTGAMVSLVCVDGNLVLTGAEEYERICTELTRVLATPLAGQGHALQVVFSCDPEESRAGVNELMRPSRVAAAGLGLDLEHVLDDWARALASYCAAESLYIAVWTRPEILPSAERERALKEARAEPGPILDWRTAQSQRAVTGRLRDAHKAVLRELVDKLRALDFQVREPGCHEAARVVRACNMPNWTAPDWRPCLPGDKLPLRQPQPGAKPLDATSFVAPPLSAQIWPNGCVVHESRYVEVDNRLYAPFIMSMPPQSPLPFTVLFRSLLREDLPWRCAMLLTGDGMRGQGLRSACASILSFASSSNKRLARSFTALHELEMAGEVCVGLQMTFVTWTRLERCRSLADARNLLSRRAARLAAAVQSWGSCDTAMVTGDPLAAYAATLPAATCASPAVKALAPLSDAVRLLPLFRPTSPWSAGEVPLRTPDGRPMPVGLFSRLCASWNEICFAGMGSGKSFFLNTLNFFFLLRPGQKRLPWLTVIDIGGSCAGVIELVRAALPPEQRHLAVFARLRNTRSHAVNPFDTLLGCPAPLPGHASFLVNLLALLCTPLDETAPADGVTDLLREALDATYRRLGPDGEGPRRFDPHPEPDITAWLLDRGFSVDENTTWWEVTRLLFEDGETRLASLAQRHAVPLLCDVLVECSNPLLRERFMSITVRGTAETIPQACARHLTTSIREYPLLAAPTRFSLGEARVVGLDLTEVTPRGGPAAERQSGIMYLLARFVGAAHFFNTLADLETIPEPYREYHRERFEDLVSSPKRLCYDEFHRASCQDMNNPLSRQILSDLTTASREARKQNLAICLYSQQLSDFPGVLVDLATSVYAMGAGNAGEAEQISTRFGFNQAAWLALRNSTRPGPAGATFVALFRTTRGESIQQLTCTAGSWALWAFSTTAEDMRVRTRLYERLGCARALETLVRHFPEGSVRPELERRRQILTAEDAGRDLVEDIIDELLERSEHEQAVAEPADVFRRGT